MNIPYGIAITDELLLVQEDENNRVLIFESR